MNQRSNHQPCRKPVLDKSCPIVAQLNVRLNAVGEQSSRPLSKRHVRAQKRRVTVTCLVA